MNIPCYVLYIFVFVDLCSAHTGWFPHVMGWYPEIKTTKERSDAIVKDWNPLQGQRKCSTIPSHSWVHWHETGNPSTLILEGELRVSVQYVDSSWLIDINNNGMLCIPPYKPIAMLLVIPSNDDAKLWRIRYDMGTEVEGDTCPEFDVSKCTLPEQNPRKLGKPTHEFFLTAAYEPAPDELSIITCGTIDRLLRIRQMAEAYQGPVSAAIYLAEKDKLEEDFHSLVTYYLKYPIMQKFVDVHVVFDDNVVLIRTADRPFPINFLRSTALRFARTLYVMYIEADFIPNLTLRNSPFLPQVKMRLREDPKQIFIILGLITTSPQLCAWDFDVEHNFIKDKEELLQKWLKIDSDLAAGVIPLSEVFTSHRHLDFATWQRANDIYRLGTTTGFEPYYIGLRDYPLFDEIMVGCGRDKVVHYEELMLAGYTSWVLPDMFIVHLDSTGMGSAWCRGFGANFPKEDAQRERALWEWTNGKGYKSQPIVWWDAAQSRLEPYLHEPSAPVLIESTQSNNSTVVNDEIIDGKWKGKTKRELVVHIEELQKILTKILSERETLKEDNENQRWNLKYLSFVLLFVTIMIGVYWSKRKTVFWTVAFVACLQLLFLTVMFWTK